MQLAIAEMINDVVAQKTVPEKVQKLKEHDNATLRRILQFTYDPSIEFNIPDTAPPYEPSQAYDNHGMLIGEFRRLNIFRKGGEYDHLRPVKRENVFINILESVHREDAEILIKMITKTKFKGLTKGTINKAYEGLIS